MSNLYNQLGPQGRALLNRQPPGSNQTVVYENDNPVPQDLDFLVNELRSPYPDTTIQKIMGFMYHYLPFIKLEYNLRIVLSSFLNNSVTFGVVAPPFEESYQIVELFRAVAEKKLKVSQPTLSIKTWYSVVTRELVNFVAYNPFQNSWKVIPVIAGLMLAKSIRYEVCSGVEYGWFFRETDEKLHRLFVECLRNSLTGYQSKDVVNLVLMSYAVVFNREDASVKSYTGNVAPEFMISKLVELIFSSEYPLRANAYRELLKLDIHSTDVEEAQVQKILLLPVVRNLNKLSFLLEAYLASLPRTSSLKSLKLVEAGLDTVLSFNKELFQRVSGSVLNRDPLSCAQTPLESHCWFFLKNVLFTEVIMFQGILSRLLVPPPRKQSLHFFSRQFDDTAECKKLSFMILYNLFYTNFILLSVGQGGFDNYNFVYYLTVELALNSPDVEPMEAFTSSIVTHDLNCCLPEMLNADYLVISKALFILGLWESYVQHKNANVRFIKEIIYPFCWKIVTNRQFTNPEMVEGCHSVLLICLSNGTWLNSSSTSIKETLEYVGVLDSQFPQLISSQQLSIAIESIGKRLLSSPIQYDNTSIHANSGEEVLDFYYFRCSNTTPGIMIPQTSLTTLESFPSARPDIEITSPSAVGPIQYQMADRVIPETTREAKIVAFIRLVPYIPLSTFERWLNKVLSLVQHSNRAEQEYLLKMYWRVLSENLDSNRSDLAMRWWYERKRIPETGLIKSMI